MEVYMKAKVTIVRGHLIEYSFRSVGIIEDLSMGKNVKRSAFARSDRVLCSCLFSVSVF